MKTTFFSIIISILFLNSCNDKGDPPFPCDTFTIHSIFRDSIFHTDVTGDTLSSTVDYIKDSIKYQIISPNINVPISSPVVTTESANTYSTHPFSLVNISNNENIYLVYYLNASTSDTVNIKIQNKTEFFIYNKGYLLSHFITFKKCDDLIFINR